MKKVLFLDIDGVLNTIASMAEGVELVPEKVIHIRDICEATQSKIVISSTWRFMYSLQELNSILRLVGLHGNLIIDKTPDMDGIRGKEIEKWLQDHPEVSLYAIVDDDADMLESQKQFFVQTNVMAGITTRERDQLIDILIRE